MRKYIEKYFFFSENNRYFAMLILNDMKNINENKKNRIILIIVDNYILRELFTTLY